MNKLLPEWEYLVTDNLRLAYAIAIRIYKTAPHVLDLDELKSVSLAALVEAAARWPDFCRSKGYSPDATNYFGRYATLRCTGACHDYNRAQDYLTRSQRERSRKIFDQMNASDENLTALELSERTGLSIKDIRDTLFSIAKAPVSLDVATSGIENESGDSVGVQIAQDEDTESRAATNSMLSAFADGVRDLPILDRLVIVLIYWKSMSIKETAATLGLNEGVVSDRHRETILKLLEILTVSAEGVKVEA